MKKLATLGLLFVVALAPRAARAESVIKRDTAHPHYALELEPHGNLGVFLPPGDADGLGLGAGLRLTIPIADEGFIHGVNDSVGIGFGLDWVHYFGSGPAAGRCAEYRGRGSDRICVRVENAGGPSHYFYVPVVMQWNFFLTEKWSVFGEPGLGLAFQSRDVDGSLGVSPYPIFQLGGRYHFTETFTLTLRTGYPTTSVGVSLLF